MTSAGDAALADALEAVQSPEGLYPLAARANALVATSKSPGILVSTHTILMALARTANDSIEPQQWDAIVRICLRLAALLRAPDIAKLDLIGFAWLDLKRPAALQ